MTVPDCPKVDRPMPATTAVADKLGEIVFTVSDTAADAIRELVANNGAPEGTGLRITTQPGATSLEAALSAEPEPGDTVYHAREAHIFVDEGAASVLDGQAIDAMTDGTGRVQFILGPPAS